jgi:hypothetical protein
VPDDGVQADAIGRAILACFEQLRLLSEVSKVTEFVAGIKQENAA